MMLRMFDLMETLFTQQITLKHVTQTLIGSYVHIWKSLYLVPLGIAYYVLIPDP